MEKGPRSAGSQTPILLEVGIRLGAGQKKTVALLCCVCDGHAFLFAEKDHGESKETP